MTNMTSFSSNQYANAILTELVRNGAFSAAGVYRTAVVEMESAVTPAMGIITHTTRPTNVSAVREAVKAVTEEVVGMSDTVQKVTDEVKDNVVIDTNVIAAYSKEEIEKQAKELGVDAKDVVFGVLNQIASLAAVTEYPAITVVEEDNDYTVSSMYGENHLRIVPDLEVYKAKTKELIGVANKLASINNDAKELKDYNEPVKHLRGIMRKIAIKEVVNQKAYNDVIEHYNELVDEYGVEAAQGYACFIMKMHFKSIRKMLEVSTEASEMIKHLYFAATTIQLYRTLNTLVAEHNAK